MSRYGCELYKGRRLLDDNCIIGYDMPMQTYFFQSGEEDKNGKPLIWLGKEFGKYKSASSLVAQLNKKGFKLVLDVEERAALGISKQKVRFPFMQIVGAAVLIFGAILFTHKSQAGGFKYSPGDLKQYEDTGICPKCDLSGYNMLSCKAGAVLTEAVLNHSVFWNGGHCENGDYSGAFMLGTAVSGSMASSNFSNAKLRGASFSGNFSSAIFQNSDLQDVNFATATLVRADFTGASVIGADFNYSDLTQAKLTKQQLDSAKSYCEAILPNGDKGPPC